MTKAGDNSSAGLRKRRQRVAHEVNGHAAADQRFEKASVERRSDWQ
jgi:hypothetical protein